MSGIYYLPVWGRISVSLKCAKLNGRNILKFDIFRRETNYVEEHVLSKLILKQTKKCKIFTKGQFMFP